MAFAQPIVATPSVLPQVGVAPLSVLVVEDQDSVRAALVSELHHAGVSDVLEAPNGDVALQLFKLHRPGLVLLDIRLPGNDG